MLILNSRNVEELVFQDKALQQRLPDFHDLFHTYAVGRRVAGLKHLCKKSVFDFFDQVVDRHVVVLSDYFGDEVMLNEADPHLVSTHSYNIEEADEKLNYAGLVGNYFVWRDESRLYVSTWR